MRFLNQLSTPVLATASIMLANLCFTINDAFFKHLSATYPLHEIVFLRALIGLLIMSVVFCYEGGFKGLKINRLHFHIMRACLVFIANVCFFLSLISISLAEATTLFFFSPVLITLWSALILREKIGTGRLLAVFLGMFGVLMIARPGFDTIDVGILLALTAALAYSILQILTRIVGLTERAAPMVIYTQIGFLLGSVAFGLVVGDGRYANPDNPTLDFLLRQWIVPTPHDAAKIVICSIAHCIASYFGVQAYRLAEASFVAPMEYISLIFAILLGILIWEEWLDYIDFAAILLIALGGIIAVSQQGKKEIVKVRPRT